MSVPRLKPMDVFVHGDRLVVTPNGHNRVELTDPDGHVARMLRLLAEGGRKPDDLAAELGVPPAEVDSALADLDALGWLDDSAAPTRLDDGLRERYFSNLAFFSAFSTLGRPPTRMQERLTEAHVAVLGVGGVGSNTLQHLVGAGVGRLTLLDVDTVEARNFTRQFLYTHAQLGQSKVARAVDWVRAFDPRVRVDAVQRRVEGPDDVSDVVTGADLVIAAIDQPEGVDLWVNAACVAADVPFIRGGLTHLEGTYWSVDPGRTACWQCLHTGYDRQLGRAAEDDLTTVPDRWTRIVRGGRLNRAIGPVGGMLGALVGLEALRYLTGFAPPVSGATFHLVDFAGAGHITTDSWSAEPDCPVCATAPDTDRDRPWEEVNR